VLCRFFELSLSALFLSSLPLSLARARALSLSHSEIFSRDSRVHTQNSRAFGGGRGRAGKPECFAGSLSSLSQLSFSALSLTLSLSRARARALSRSLSRSLCVFLLPPSLRSLPASSASPPSHTFCSSWADPPSSLLPLPLSAAVQAKTSSATRGQASQGRRCRKLGTHARDVHSVCAAQESSRWMLDLTLWGNYERSVCLVCLVCLSTCRDLFAGGSSCPGATTQIGCQRPLDKRLLSLQRI
jgi:hypothetical protein